MTVRNLVVSIIVLVTLPVSIYVVRNYVRDAPIVIKHSSSPSSLAPRIKSDFRAKAVQAKQYAHQNNFNTSICFLIDMSLPSGSNRFIVYDMARDSVLKAGLVAHGRCNEEWLEGRKYGNTVGCGCTSLGKYRVGYAYNGRFGEAFKLFGLDSTNNKAFERFVVLHSYECVPERETTEEICQSDGCPMVSPAYLRQLKSVIKSSGKPLLLWIYN